MESFYPDSTIILDAEIPSSKTNKTASLPHRKPRRIVVCCDGTWQDSDDDTKDNPSNVTLIYESIVKTADPTSIVNQLSGNHRLPRTFDELTDLDDKGYDQVTYYFPGVATHDNKFFHRLFCAASGAGLIEKVREAYATIVQNWRPGDEIYLFGFSRGAYTVRTVGGLIAEYGLLIPDAMCRFYELLHIYQATAVRSYEKSDHTRPFKDSEWRSRDVHIKVIGVWDTVGSMGMPDMNLFGLRLNKVKEIDFLHRLAKKFNRRYEFPDKLVHRHVQFAFHALALDEKRSPFRPALWRIDTKKNNITTLKQVWFAGVHCSVGGGEFTQALSDIPLAWMVEQVKHYTDLVFDKAVLKQKGAKTWRATPWGCGEWEESYTGVYHIAGWHHRKPGHRYFPKHEGRHIETFEEIHESVKNRLERSEDKPLGKYKPHGIKNYRINGFPKPLAKLGKLEKEFKWD